MKTLVNGNVRGKALGRHALLGARTFFHGADKIASRYGGIAGKVLQGAAPVIGALAGPQSGILAGALGKGLSTYSEVRGAVGN